jgi:acyl-CoA synthetase (AMP-forming)/AMP-acid ligase II
MLVTTPFHLKLLLDAGVALPPVDLTVCATAPLSPQLAARAEAALDAPLVEIYGCTEAGQVATRQTTVGPDWHTFGTLRLEGDGDRTIVDGGHVPQPTQLADVLEVIDAQHFRLLGRSNDLVNIAGKRSSIGHLNYHLNAIDGVVDGAFWMPPERAGDPEVVRLVAFVVAPQLSDSAIVAALRQRSTPRSCHAASSRSRACRATRPASCRPSASLPSPRRRARCRWPRRHTVRTPRDDAGRTHGRARDRGGSPCVRRPLSGPAAAARRRAVVRGARGGARRTRAGGIGRQRTAPCPRSSSWRRSAPAPH